MRYCLEQRYQDSQWTPLYDHDNFSEELGFHSINQAVQTAADLSRNSIIYGMVRVVDIERRRIIIEFSAGMVDDILV